VTYNHLLGMEGSASHFVATLKPQQQVNDSNFGAGSALSTSTRPSWADFSAPQTIAVREWRRMEGRRVGIGQERGRREGEMGKGIRWREGKEESEGRKLNMDTADFYVIDATDWVTWWSECWKHASRDCLRSARDWVTWWSDCKCWKHASRDCL